MKIIRFAKFSWFVLAWNLAVILWGAYVRATGSGAGCGSHWPLCNGAVIPQAPQVHTLIEFTHRMMSGTAMLLVLAMLVWGWKIYPKGHHVRTGLTLSATFIIVEALLGAGLVLLELTAENDSVARAAAMSIHLANTFILVACLTLTAAWASGLPPLRLKGQKALPWLLVGLTGVILIGMSGAVTALGDTLFPVDSLRAGLEADRDSSAHFLIRLRVYHPVIAVLVAVYSLYLIRHLLGAASGLSRRLLLLLGATFIVQLAAGVINLLLLAPIPMQIVHLFLADLIWIAYVLASASILSGNGSTSSRSTGMQSLEAL
jgi:heme A synthase